MRNIFLLLLVLVLAACSSGADEALSDEVIQTAIAQTLAAQPEPTYTAAQAEPVIPTLRPTSTPIPTVTPAPTDTSLPSIPTQPGAEELFAKNFLAVQDSGGLRVEIGRVLIGTKSVLESRGFHFSEIEIYDDVNVIGEIIFIVQNTTDKVITVYPDQATVVIGDEQIDIFDWSWESEIGDDYYGDIYPGVKAVGGTWFGIKRSEVKDITQMIIAFDAPYDENYDDIGPDFYFELDLSEHIWEELPDELK